MAYYNKGANAERELIHKLYNMGFSVARVAGSGCTSLPSPDVVALSPNKKLAIECKAWARPYLHIEKQQMHELEDWAQKAGVDLYVAWKVPHKGWIFLPKNLFSETQKAYTISLKDATKYGMDITVVTGQQKQLGAKK